jgi:hypothetical protein
MSGHVGGPYFGTAYGRIRLGQRVRHGCVRACFGREQVEPLWLDSERHYHHRRDDREPDEQNL